MKFLWLQKWLLGFGCSTTKQNENKKQQKPQYQSKKVQVTNNMEVAASSECINTRLCKLDQLHVRTTNNYSKCNNNNSNNNNNEKSYNIEMM